MKSATFSCFVGAFSPAFGENAPNFLLYHTSEHLSSTFLRKNAQKIS